MSWDSAVARALEAVEATETPPPGAFAARGTLDGVLARGAARAWGALAARAIARPLERPSPSRGVAIVTVGGATLGGSGKTPLALACALALGELTNGRVALVGHAYRARPERARVVHPDDAVRAVGDEALACARAIARASARGSIDVIVAPTRQAAVDLAATRAKLIVFDGPLQLRPRRADLSLLAVDAEAPWGSLSHPPRGDLRAPIESLRANADLVVAITDPLAPTPARDQVPDALVAYARADGAFAPAGGGADGAFIRGELIPFDALAAHRENLALVTVEARPGRILRWLARRGVTPAHVAHGARHRPPKDLHPTALLLASAKTSAHLPRQAAILDYRLDLPDLLLARLGSLAPAGLSRTSPP